MAQILNTTVSADGNTVIDWKPLRKDMPNRGTVAVFGGGGSNFGSGTVALEASFDGGTTFIPVPDQSGTAVTFTADGMTNFELYGNADPVAGERTHLRLALSGSTTPTIVYVINDAR